LLRRWKAENLKKAKGKGRKIRKHGMRNMNEIVIISGKGGTGKTSLTASFAALAKDVVLADCDVDAADLHLLLHPDIQRREAFTSGATAVIDPAQCVQCGVCREVCRFDAINAAYTVNPFACEGCQVCAYLCPVNAIAMHDNVCGEWYLSETKYGPMVHAQLGAGAENSGKLVAIVRQQAQQIAEAQQKSLIIIDGPPGIGCPVMSTLTGTTFVVIVTEPTLSGLHDLQRVVELTAHFKIPTGVCVNKYDLNQAITGQIETYCADRHLSFLGVLPYDLTMVKALVQRVPVVKYAQNGITDQIRQIWQKIEQQLNSA
jgi:MinD superfamily P-loop ATPase